MELDWAMAGAGRAATVVAEDVVVDDVGTGTVFERGGSAGAACLLAAERDGPSSSATLAVRGLNDLYSYFAANNELNTPS